MSDGTKWTIMGILLFGYLSFSIILYTNQASPATATYDADQGKMLWQQHNCISCHQIYSLGGYLGPDLTNTYSLRGAEYIRIFLKHGTNIMPDFNLTDKEIDHLVIYLREIDASGKSDPRSFAVGTYGTIHQQ